MMEFLLELNWLAVGQIILIDILLGGDNAIVIALACRNLPPALRLRGIMWGTMGAIAMRIVLIAFAVSLLEVAFLKLFGGLLLFWIGVKLMAENDGELDDIHASDRLLGAIKTIVIADLIMSIDNVIAVASVAEQAGGNHQLALVIFGIAVSIPIIVGGSTLVLKLMEKIPVIVTLGAAMLGYLAGGLMTTDVLVQAWFHQHPIFALIDVPGMGVALSPAGVAGALSVVILGHLLAKRSA